MQYDKNHALLSSSIPGLPEPVRAFYVAAKHQPHRRLSDFFEEVVRDGLGEAAT